MGRRRVGWWVAGKRGGAVKVPLSVTVCACRTAGASDALCQTPRALGITGSPNTASPHAQEHGMAVPLARMATSLGLHNGCLAVTRCPPCPS